MKLSVNETQWLVCEPGNVLQLNRFRCYNPASGPKFNGSFEKQAARAWVILSFQGGVRQHMWPPTRNASYKHRLLNRINGEVKSTKASYYASPFVQSNGDSRKTWQLINELTSRQKNNASVKELKLNENSVTNSHELSNAFNDHFSTTGTKLANEVPLVTDGSSYADYIVSSDNKFIFSPISSSNFFSLLNKLSKSKATGLDNISAKLIRECADLISISLCNIFNNSWPMKR